MGGYEIGHGLYLELFVIMDGYGIGHGLYLVLFGIICYYGWIWNG